LRSAFNLLAARIASATDIELLKTIFEKIYILLHLIFLIIDHYNSFRLLLWPSLHGSCIAVAEMIISLHKNNFPPFNLDIELLKTIFDWPCPFWLSITIVSP
jgi:hypothetical protein